MEDMSRNIWASFGNAEPRRANGAYVDLLPSGATIRSWENNSAFVSTALTMGWSIEDFDGSRVVPTGAPNIPRSRGSRACSYFGQRATV